MKALLSIGLPLAIFASAQHCPAQSSHTLTASEVVMEGNTIVRAAYRGSAYANLTVPSEIGGVRVEAVASRAFWDRGIRRLTLSPGVRIVGARAFGRNPFTAIELGEGLEEIGDSAFFHSTNSTPDIEELRIPDSVTRMGPGAFCDCPLKKLTLGRGLKVIPREAFAWGQLTQVDIPEGVESIERDAFGWNQIGRISLPASLRHLGGFGNNAISELTIPPTVESVGDSAFFGNRLTAVLVPKNVVSVGNYAFAQNRREKENHAGPLVQWENTIKSLVVESGVGSVGEGAFNPSSSATLLIPASVATIGPGAFGGSYGSVVVEEGRVALDAGALAYVRASDGISLPQSLKTIGDYAMVNTYNRYEVKEEFMALPRALERIGKGAFGETYFRNISLSSESRLTVDDEAFEGDWYLKSVFIGEGVVSIGRDCFAKRETYRNTKVDLRQASDLVHILPGAFAEAGRPDVALPQGRRWRAYRGHPGNWQGSGYATRIDDTSLGYIAEGAPTAIAEVRTRGGETEAYDLQGRRLRPGAEAGRDVRARRSGDGRRVVVF